MLKPFSRNSPTKPQEAIFYTVFRYNFQPEIDNDVISGVDVAVDYIDMDVHIRVGDSRSNGSQDIRGADFVSNERTYQSLSHKVEMPYMHFA